MKVPALEPVAPGVWLMRGGLFKSMNVYFIEDEGQVTVFDSGEKGMAKGIVAAASRMGGLKRVVLGHGDTDHRGSAPALSAHAPVLCHPDAVGEAEGSGGRSYWDMSKLPPSVRAVHRFAHRFVWDGGPVQISGTVAEGDVIADFEVVLLDGHAPGMIGLRRASTAWRWSANSRRYDDVLDQASTPAYPHLLRNDLRHRAGEALRREARSARPRGHRRRAPRADERRRASAPSEAAAR